MVGIVAVLVFPVAALAVDATATQAADNLGVFLADEGHLSGAADAFRQARAANPDYAIAAFNLGLVLGRMGPSSLVEARRARHRRGMNETPTMSSAGRATAVFVAAPAPILQCSHCGAEITDDDADCPTCTTPLDWGASRVALQEWYDRAP